MKKSFAKSSLRLFVSLLLVLLTLVPVCGITASAQSLNDPAYDNYIYWSAPGATRPTTATPMYELERTVTGATLGTGPISEPSDVYVDAAGLIYLVDAANGRVLVMNPDYTLKTEIKGLSYNGFYRRSGYFRNQRPKNLHCRYRKCPRYCYQPAKTGYQHFNPA